MAIQTNIGLPERAILTSRNESVYKINETIITKFQGQGKFYLSADTVAEEDLQNTYPTDFLNFITLPGWITCYFFLKISEEVLKVD